MGGKNPLGGGVRFRRPTLHCTLGKQFYSVRNYLNITYQRSKNNVFIPRFDPLGFVRDFLNLTVM